MNFPRFPSRYFRWSSALLLIAVLIGMGCLQSGVPNPTAAPSMASPTAGTVTPNPSISREMVPSLEPSPVTETELVVYTYDGITSEWGLGPKIFPPFERECGCKVKTVAPGDVGAMLSRLTFEKNAPKADVALGTDNTFKETAIARDLFEPYRPSNYGDIDGNLQETDARFTPFDWGFVTFVYDTQFAGNPAEFSPPRRLDDLLEPRFYKRLVIEDARTSSPGKILLYWIAAQKGNGTRAFLEKLKSQVLTVSPGWSEAYNLFLAGEVPMVLSYSTSPAYHIVNDNTTRYQAAMMAALPRQVEYVSVVKGAPHPVLARKFVDFMISQKAQEQIPLGNYMYPVRANQTLPPAFLQTELPNATVELSASTGEAMRIWDDVFS